MLTKRCIPWTRPDLHDLDLMQYVVMVAAADKSRQRRQPSFFGEGPGALCYLAVFVFRHVCKWHMVVF